MSSQTSVPSRQLRDADRYAKRLLLQRKLEAFEDEGKQTTYPYRRVIILMLTWKDGDRAPEDLQKLREWEDLYRNQYRFDVFRCRISTSDSQQSTEEIFERYRHYFDDPSNLLIVYYLGHGGVESGLDLQTSNQKEGQSSETPVGQEIGLRFMLSAWNLKNKQKAQTKQSPELDWIRISSRLQGLKSDVIVLMESCDSVAAFHPSERQGLSDHRMEIISACGYRGTASNTRFGDAIAFELSLKAKEAEAKPFTLASFYRCILGDYIQQHSGQPQEHMTKNLKLYPTPIYINMGGELGSTSIPLKAFKRDRRVHAIPLQHFLVDLPGIRESGNNNGETSNKPEPLNANDQQKLD